MRLPLVFVCLLALTLAAVSAQQPGSADPAAARADEAYSGHDWPAAESLYAGLLQQQPQNARFWYRLGVSARANRHNDIALDALKKAKALGAGKGLAPALADYEIATTYAGMGNNPLALQLLKASADAGFMQPARLHDDEQWNALRADDRFLALVHEVQHNATPCDDAEFRQFDFWVGDWDVASAADGTHRGTSHVSKEMNGCVVWENWTSAGSGYFGKSYNTWNPNLKRWEQYWVDNAAGVMFFHGSLKGNVMDYWTDDVPQATGGTLLRHLQFFNLGSGKVRQFSQASSDGGKTWQPEYDLIYTRAAPAGN